MLKMIKFTTSVLLITFWTLLVQAAPLHSRCQSETRCFYSFMPLYTQHDDSLERYIGGKINVPNYVDTGLCVPTTATMVLFAVLSEKHPQTQLNNDLLNNFIRTDWKENLYKIGVLARTNFKKGGTSLDGIKSALSSLYRSITPKISKNFWSDAHGRKFSDETTASLIQKIKAEKLAIYFSADQRKKKKTGLRNVVYYDLVDGHAMAIKGFDGDRLLVFDPWGIAYFIRITREDMRLGALRVKRHYSVAHALQPYGFIGSNQDQFKLVLDNLIGMTVD